MLHAEKDVSVLKRVGTATITIIKMWYMSTWRKIEQQETNTRHLDIPNSKCIEDELQGTLSIPMDGHH